MDRPAATPSPIVLRCAEFVPLIAELDQSLEGVRVDVRAVAVNIIAQPVQVALLAQPTVHQDFVVWPAAQSRDPETAAQT